MTFRRPPEGTFYVQSRLNDFERDLSIIGSSVP
jgi:hypothetical protein